MAQKATRLAEKPTASDDVDVMDADDTAVPALDISERLETVDFGGPGCLDLRSLRCRRFADAGVAGVYFELSSVLSALGFPSKKAKDMFKASSFAACQVVTVDSTRWARADIVVHAVSLAQLEGKLGPAQALQLLQCFQGFLFDSLPVAPASNASAALKESWALCASKPQFISSNYKSLTELIDVPPIIEELVQKRNPPVVFHFSKVAMRTSNGSSEWYM
jgi:hypothetical protein